jgi:hypothetical protein
VEWRTIRPLRGMVFDIENRPGTYGGGDYVFPKVTAIGCLFLDEKHAKAWVLHRNDPKQVESACTEFRKVWDKSDFVIGHNIRRHDRKILDGLYTALGLPLLAPKRMVDTYLDQPKMSGFSRSLENLASRWRCPERKMSLSEYDWERAYDSVPEGLTLMRERVMSDVRISKWLYYELLERRLLKVA